jgi:hypothetical protein
MENLMPRYKESIIIMHCNDRVRFVDFVEEAIMQGYVPFGFPLYDGVKGDYILYMIKSELNQGISDGKDLREILQHHRRVSQHICRKEFPDDADQTRTNKTPFGP